MLKALTKHSNTVVSAIARTNLYYMHSDFPAKDLPELLFTGITANGKTEVETHINGRSYKVKSKKENL